MPPFSDINGGSVYVDGTNDYLYIGSDTPIYTKMFIDCNARGELKGKLHDPKCDHKESGVIIRQDSDYATQSCWTCGKVITVPLSEFNPDKPCGYYLRGEHKLECDHDGVYQTGAAQHPDRVTTKGLNWYCSKCGEYFADDPREEDDCKHITVAYRTNYGYYCARCNKKLDYLNGDNITDYYGDFFWSSSVGATCRNLKS